MKWIGRILYIFIVFMIGSSVLNYSHNKRDYTFFTEKTKDTVENYDRDEYIKYFMTASHVKEYYNKPVYEGQDEESKLDFAIYHSVALSRKEEFELLFFYFRDINLDLAKNYLADVEVYDNYQKEIANNEYSFSPANLRIQVYFDDNEKPTFNSTENLDKALSMPFPLAYVGKEDIKGKDPKDLPSKFVYYAEDTENEGKSKLYYGNEITKIEMILVDRTKVKNKDDKAIETNILTITNDKESSMDKKDVFTKNENVYTSNNFNGKIENFEAKNLYNENTKGDLVFDEIKEFQHIVVKARTIYIIVATVATYLIFFLKPTINYFKERNYERKKLSLAEDTNNIVIDAEVTENTAQQIFHDPVEKEDKQK